MKTTIASLFAVIALICLCGCGDDSPKNTQQARNELSGVKRVEVPLDGNNGQISTALNVYVIFDGSGSMDGRCAGKTKIEGAKEAVAKVMANVSDEIQLGLYVFDSHGDREVVSLAARNRTQFLRAVQDVDTGGGTPLAEAIHCGTDRLVAQYKKQLGYGEYRLVVVTDGEASGLDEAAKYAASYGVPIYTIGLDVGEDHPLRLYSVSYVAADNYDALAKGLQDTMGELPSFDQDDFTPKK